MKKHEPITEDIPTYFNHYGQFRIYDIKDLRYIQENLRRRLQQEQASKELVERMGEARRTFKRKYKKYKQRIKK